MGKQEIKQRETQVATGNGVGKQLEQTYIVDDNCLPSPQELAAYKEIDPRIVDYLINASVKEQEHRHKIDESKINLVRRANRQEGRMYLDKPWFAGVLGAGTLISVASIFVKSNETKESQEKRGK